MGSIKNALGLAAPGILVTISRLAERDGVCFIGGCVKGLLQ